MTTKFQEYVLRFSPDSKKEKVAQSHNIDTKMQQIIALSRSNGVLLKLMSNPALSPKIQDAFITKFEHFSIPLYLSDKSESSRKDGKENLLELMGRLASNQHLDSKVAHRMGQALVEVDKDVYSRLNAINIDTNTSKKLLSMRQTLYLIAENLLDHPRLPMPPGLSLTSEHFGILAGKRYLRDKTESQIELHEADYH